MIKEEKIVATKRSVEADFLRRPGVHAVGLGPKIVNGEITGELAIQIFLKKKRPLATLATTERIPDEIEGIKTDVVERPPASLATDDTGMYRPLKGGTQIQVPPQTTPDAIFQSTGTLGCIAETADGTAVVLSNYHILFSSPSTIGSSVGQPDRLQCGDCCNNIIGEVLGGVHNAHVDAAIASLNPGVQWLAEVVEIGPVSGTYTVSLQDIMDSAGYPVKKRGRTTELTEGRIVSVNLSGTTSDGWVFTDQIAVNPKIFAASFSKGGDSGSVVMDDQDRIVGLLWGGEASVGSGGSGGGYATPIKVVEDTLHISIATASEEGVSHTVPGAEAEINEVITGGGSLSPVAQGEMWKGARPPGNEIIPLHQFEMLRQQGFDVDAWLDHIHEIRMLIQTNRRVAAAWRRVHGAKMLRSLLGGQYVAPPRDGNIPGQWVCTLDPFIALLDRYGSAALCADLVEFRRIVAFIDDAR